MLREAQRGFERLRELDSELGELEIQSSRSWKSRAQGAVLGAGLREAIEQDFPTCRRPPGRAKKEKVCLLNQDPREAQK